MCRGAGAWELASRVSYLKLNDDNVRGGKIADYTAGLNWYLNPYVKWQFNYIHSYTTDANDIAANTDLFDLRLQADF
ncbi:MAG: porin [Pirellulales bacterium]